jgi:hypothetical protein
MHRGHHILSSDSLLLCRPGIESVQIAEEGIDHGVADEMNLGSRNALVSEVSDGVGAGNEEQTRQAVSDKAVDFLRHRQVEAAQPSLHMGDSDTHFGRNQSGCECGVHIAVDDHQIWLVLNEEILQCSHDGGSLVAVAARADAEIDVRARQLQLTEEHFRHLVVVVLAGMNQQLVHGIRR